MNAAMLVEQTSIVWVWQLLGGGPIRNPGLRRVSICPISPFYPLQLYNPHKH